MAMYPPHGAAFAAQQPMDITSGRPNGRYSWDNLLAQVKTDNEMRGVDGISPTWGRPGSGGFYTPTPFCPFPMAPMAWYHPAAAAAAGLAAAADTMRNIVMSNASKRVRVWLLRNMGCLRIRLLSSFASRFAGYARQETSAVHI